MWQVVNKVLVLTCRCVLDMLFLAGPFSLRERRCKFWRSGFKVQFLRCFLSCGCIFYLAIIKAEVAPMRYSMVPALPGLFLE